MKIAVFFNNMLFTPSENSYRFYLHKFLLFILLIANSGNYLHLSIVVHYKIVRTNNVLSVNIVLIKIRLLNGCHLIGTIKHSIHLYPNPTLYEIWKGRKKFGKRQIRTRVDHVKKHMPYHLYYWNFASLCNLNYPNHTLVGGVSVNRVGELWRQSPEE